jgi:hypothetical protein
MFASVKLLHSSSKVFHQLSDFKLWKVLSSYGGMRMYSKNLSKLDPKEKDRQKPSEIPSVDVSQVFISNHLRYTLARF